MLRTSSLEEGGLQERTASPKATSGTPNGFVRPVAVAGIFCPALGVNSEAIGLDGRPAVPDKRRPSVAKEGRVFGSSLSSEEFSRRRQSFDSKTAILVGQNALKQTTGNCSSPVRTVPNCDSALENIDEVSLEKHLEETDCSLKTKNDAASISVKPPIVSEKEAVSRKEKEKNSTNTSQIKSTKSNIVQSLPNDSDLAKVVSFSEDNTPVIQNGIPDDIQTHVKLAVAETRPRIQNTAATDCVGESSTPQAGRRRRNKFSGNTGVDKEVTSSVLQHTHSVGASSFQGREIFSSGSNKDTSEETFKNQNVTVTESSLKPTSLQRRRDTTLQETCTVKNTESDAKIFSKDQPLQSNSNADCGQVSIAEKNTQHASETLPTKTDSLTLKNDEKSDNIDALDSQPGSKFRTCRRTSDVIAAKIQTIFSKNEKPLTLPSSNKLSTSKLKVGSALPEKEPKSGPPSAEKDNVVSQGVPNKKDDHVKNLSPKEDSCHGTSGSVVDPVSLLTSAGSSSSIHKSELPNTGTLDLQKNVKGSQKVESFGTVEKKLKLTNKVQAETKCSVVESVTTHLSSSTEKSVAGSYMKDGRSSQKSHDSPASLTIHSTLSSSVESKKISAKEVPSHCTSSTIIAKKETSLVKGLASSSPVPKEESVRPSTPKKPVASINFLITEVSVETSPVSLKVNSGKISPLQVGNKEITQNVKQINNVHNPDTKKGANDVLKSTKFASKAEVINTEASVPKRPAKSKIGWTPLLKEETSGSAVTQYQQSSPIKKSFADESVGVDAKHQNLPELVNSRAVVSNSSERDRTGKSLSVSEGNKVPSENLQQKGGQEQKFGTKKNAITSKEILSSTSSEVVKTLEKDVKIVRSLPLEDCAKVSEKSLPKTNQTQKLSAEGKASCDIETQSSVAGVQALKPSEKDQAKKTSHEAKGPVENLSQKSVSQVLNVSLGKGNKISRSVPHKESTEVPSENLIQKTSQSEKTSTPIHTSCVKTNSESSVSDNSVNCGVAVQKPLEKCNADKPLTSNEDVQQANKQAGKLSGEESSVRNLKGKSAGPELVKLEPGEPKPSEKGQVSNTLQVKENKVVLENTNKRSYIFQQWAAKENTAALKGKNVSTISASIVSDVSPLKQSENITSKAVPPRSGDEMPCEAVKEKFSAVQKLGSKESVPINSTTENVTSSTAPVNSSKIYDDKEQNSEVDTKSFNSAEVARNSQKQISEGKNLVKVKKGFKQEQKSGEIAKSGEVKKTPVVKTFSSFTVGTTTSAVVVSSSAPVTAPPSASITASSASVVISSGSIVTPLAPVVATSVSVTSSTTDPASQGVVSQEGLPSRVSAGQVLKNFERDTCSQSPTTKKSVKHKSEEGTVKETKYLSMQPQDSAEPKVGSTHKRPSLVGTNSEHGTHQNAVKTSVSDQKELTSACSNKQINKSSIISPACMQENQGNLKPLAHEVSVAHQSAKDVEDLLMGAKGVVPRLSRVQGSSSFESKMRGSDEVQRVCSGVLVEEKDSDSDGSITPTNTNLSLTERSSSAFHLEYPGRSSSFSKFETPRPPERKRTGFLRETCLMSPPPRAPHRSVSRVGSLKRPDDSRLSMDRSLSILRSASHSILSPPYATQRISYTEMLSKLGTYGLSPSTKTSNRKSGISQVSELWADLSEEQSNSAHASEMLESETSERMQLEKEVQELQSRYSQMQQKSDKMEMEMMEARVYRATEVNGDLSEEEENDAALSIYKQKYERAVRDMEIMKRRLQQQHEEELEQSMMLKKAADKRLTEALEDVEEERQVVNQWKRKAQKLGAELQDLRLMLEEQMARNGELEKKQRRFDAELSASQEEIRKEHQIREKLMREKDQALLEKYSLEQELQATRLDMDMQHEKIALLNRELDELSLSSKGEEEVTQLKRAKQELERKTRDQEEELEELAGQVQMLEQSKLRLEMSLEKLRQEHRRESSVRDEEIEEIRACTSKKIKNLEAQLENEQEERHQLVKQKHELERRIIELSDQPPPQDPEIERRLRRDLKRTKALLRDAQSMLEHVRDGQANKTLIRQLKNQLEDAEFTKSVAIKARQTAELELQESQSQLEEMTRTKNETESRCLQLSREKSALQTQLEEMEEELADIMKKYKAAVAQMSIDQKTLAEQCQQICELEGEKLALKEQLAEVSTKLDHISVHTEDTSRVHRLDAKVRDLESKLELEQTTRTRLEHQIARLKEQCDKNREECESLRNKELQAQEGTRRLQRQLRELREDYAALQQKESEAYRKQHELEMALENTEADLQVTKNDLRLACQRIQDLQNALEDDLDSGTDVPDDSGSESDSSLDVSVLSRQCLTPLQRSDSVSSNTSIGSESRQLRALSHSQDMAFFSRMMQRRTSMDFLI